MEPHGLGRVEGGRVRVRPGAESATAPEAVTATDRGPSAVRRATVRAGAWMAPPALTGIGPEDPGGSTPTLSAVLAAAAERPGEEAGRTPAARRVRCCGCGTDYGLPSGLTPPWGGRVRCPRCGTVFSVGARADADELVAQVMALDPAAWRSAADSRTLWTEWGAALLDAYGTLRTRHGAQVAARAFRRALEDAAPGVPWLAPPTVPSPLEIEPAAAGGTMFERRQGG